MKQSTNSTFKSTKQTRNLRKYPRKFAKDKLTLKTAFKLKSQFSGTNATSLSRNKNIVSLMQKFHGYIHYSMKVSKYLKLFFLNFYKSIEMMSSYM